ncbi:hypothetical protein [Erythrobacter sp. F6033]|uniref:hypothetical protein n=1 Tax=Erythrobacter sp. F6033 TaxID=2926401 RepID=UPI001FF11CAC|nr:hypothetical protein [Erythrobacter sp. F6033]MCK0129656.1 hypothetical protein [Erythrobacter sp. F6033]
MPRWLVETFAEIIIRALGVVLALVVTLIYAFTWFANGGATTSEPLDPVAQLVVTALWLAILTAIGLGTRRLLSIFD